MRSKSLSSLLRKYGDLQTVWFEYDGATTHTSFAVLNWLGEHLGACSYPTEQI